MEGEWIADGKYRLTRLLGRGAFSEVYLATDREGERYACKLSEKTDMLKREAFYQKEIGHPLFPRYVEEGEGVRGGWLVMEYIQGETLEEHIRRRGYFSEKEAAEIGERLAEGLACLHERSRPLVFRDIKPANVILGEGRQTRLVDLGCVCAAGERTGFAGTPGFGAPEQFTAGDGQGITADVYGLGRTLLAMTGNKYRGRLGRVLRRCTKSAPQDRLPDMRSVSELLAVCRGEGGRRRFSDTQKAILRGEISFVKNIWESDCKKA